MLATQTAQGLTFFCLAEFLALTFATQSMSFLGIVSYLLTTDSPVGGFVGTTAKEYTLYEVGVPPVVGAVQVSVFE